MSNPQISQNEPIAMGNVKEELLKIKKRDGELTFRSEKTLEYLNEMHTFSEKEIKEIKDKIEKLKVPRLKEEYIIKIIDVIPKSEEELKTVLSSYPFTITKENMSHIFKVLEDYLDKKKTKNTASE